MSFAQWHRKHKVPSDCCSQSWFVLVCLSVSVIDTKTHTHTHTQTSTHTQRRNALDTPGPLHCQHGEESSFCSALISLWVLNWQLRGAEYSYYYKSGCVWSSWLHPGVLIFQLQASPDCMQGLPALGIFQLHSFSFPSLPVCLFATPQPLRLHFADQFARIKFGALSNSLPGCSSHNGGARSLFR